MVAMGLGGDDVEWVVGEEKGGGEREGKSISQAEG